MIGVQFFDNECVCQPANTLDYSDSTLLLVNQGNTQLFVFNVCNVFGELLFKLLHLFLLTHNLYGMITKVNTSNTIFECHNSSTCMLMFPSSTYIHREYSYGDRKHCSLINCSDY